MVFNFPILLVEDDTVDVMSIKRAFKANGVKNPLHVANNGEEALAYLNSTDKEECPRPGVIITDINMPLMSGKELLAKLKESDDFRSIPVYVLTTSNDPSDINDCYQIGISGYIIKPDDYDKTVEVVRRLKDLWEILKAPQLTEGLLK